METCSIEYYGLRKRALSEVSRKNVGPILQPLDWDLVTFDLYWTCFLHL